MPLAEVSYLVLEGGKPSALELALENSAFSLSIGRGEAVFRLKTEVSSLDDAIRRVEEYMHSWDADLTLQTGAIPRRFVGPGCYAPGLGGRGIPATGTLTIGGPVADANARKQYPWRYHPYCNHPLLASLIERYTDYRRGRERLSVLGYLALSAFENAFGGRANLASACKISKPVLSTMAIFVSELGSYRSARKIGRQHALRDLTAHETFWLETVTRHLIHRAGARLTGQPDAFSHLTLSTLPPRY